MNETTGNRHPREKGDALAELVRVGGHRASPTHADYDAVLAVATASWQRAVGARSRRRWIGALAAGVALFALGLGVLHLRPVTTGTPPVAVAKLVRGELYMQMPGEMAWRPLQPDAVIGNGARLRANGPAGAAFALSAGGSVRLRSSTELAVTSGTHLQLLAGCAYFDSGTRSSREPIVVETALGTVRDIGTVFEVQASRGTLRIRVREGRVLVSSPGRDGALESRAGQELQLHADGSTQRAGVATVGAQWDWAEVLAIAPVVDGKPLLGFLEWVAHESGRTLEFHTSADRQQAAAVLLHGSVPDLRPLDALDLMLAATDFEYTLSDAGAIVIRRRVS